MRGAALDRAKEENLAGTASPDVVPGATKPVFADVLGVRVGRFTREELTAAFEQLVRGGVRGWVSYVNVHAVNLSHEFPWMSRFLNDSLLTYCDGAGVRVASRWLNGVLPERIVFTDWIYDVCGVCEKTGAALFLLGTQESVIEQTRERLLKLFPRLRIAGVHHGFFGQPEDQRVVEQINSSGADVLIVGRGMPLQELWIREQFSLLSVRLVLNGGSCFDYVAGVKRRCPSWMGKTGLEWLYRMFQEPRRLWKRYLIGNPLFLFKVLFHRLAATNSRVPPV